MTNPNQLILAAIQNALASPDQGPAYFARPHGSYIVGLRKIGQSYDAKTEGRAAAEWLMQIAAAGAFQEVTDEAAKMGVTFGKCRYFCASTNAVAADFDQRAKEAITLLSDLQKEQYGQVHVRAGNHGEPELVSDSLPVRTTDVLHVVVGNGENPQEAPNASTATVFTWYPGRLTPFVKLANATVKLQRQNPEWARRLGRSAYEGTQRAAQYAAEVGRDLYRGVQEARTSASTRRAPSVSTAEAGMPKALVDKVEELADVNYYPEALLEVARALHDKALIAQAKAHVAQTEASSSGLTPELDQQRSALAAAVFQQAAMVWGPQAAQKLSDAYHGAIRSNPRGKNMPRLRLNPDPSDATVERALAILADTSLDPDYAADLANRLLAGEEIAEALTGTGLVVDTSPRPAQIAEVATAQGIVEVPVKEAPAAQKPSVNEIAASLEDPNGFRSREDAQNYLTSLNLSASELRSLAKVLSVADASIKRIVDSTVGARVHSETILGLDLGRRSAARDPVADAVQAIDALRHAAQTARRHAETEGLRERAAQILAGLSVSDLKQVAQHYSVYLQRVPADQRVERIIEATVGFILRNRAVRGDYEEDEEARVRERDEQMQMQMDAYRERHGLPPAPTVDESNLSWEQSETLHKERRRQEKQREFLVRARERAGLPMFPDEDELALHPVAVDVFEQVGACLKLVDSLTGEEVEPVAYPVPLHLRTAPSLLSFQSLTDPNSHRGQLLRRAGFSSERSRPGWVYFIYATTEDIKKERGLSSSESPLLIKLQRIRQSLRSAINELELEG